MKNSGIWGTCKWAIDEHGILILGSGIAASINEYQDIPWVDSLNDIVGFIIDGIVEFEKSSSLDGMFLNCHKLQIIDFTGLNTRGVVSMRAMFAGCSSLRSLDISNFDVSEVESTQDMLTGTESLISLVVPRGFQPHGGNITKAAKKGTGMHTTYYVPGMKYEVSYLPNGGEGDISSSAIQVIAGETIRVSNNFYSKNNSAFREWNTRRDGSGLSYRPGENLLPVYTDTTLYAIWAGTPILDKPEDIPPFTYGERIPFALPSYSLNCGPEPRWKFQISPDGQTNWADINPNVILPAKGNGCYIRYQAQTFIGSTNSDPVRLTILKADYDMSNARWVAPEDDVYDGKVKECRIENLPEGVTAEIVNAEAVIPGEYKTV